MDQVGLAAPTDLQTGVAANYTVTRADLLVFSGMEIFRD
jgi:hypothetical protein